MNYYAHGLRFLDRPYFVAGTAVPDWLSVVDRKVRFRMRHVQAFLEQATGLEHEVASGILQHLVDDDWFHKTREFVETSDELTLLFREALPGDVGFRPAFLGHILTEMLLDSVLIEREPHRLEHYYQAFADLDPRLIEGTVNQIAKETTDRLHIFIPLFVQERFLSDYGDPELLLGRLNQVMRRVTLSPLPDNFVSALVSARAIVEQRVEGLLAGWQTGDS
ncbi:MAG: hypothetical protein JSS02_02085 [Planctomycetes bacterium]|nr:hypothetical protein [Planctomycetota bacterium]